MREILFRGKTVETKEWVFGFYNHCHRKGNKHTIRVQKDSHLEDHFIDPETVGQYTGYETKEKKWFKGDILEVYARNLIGVIEFYNGAYYACDYRNKTRIALHLLFEDKAEIIGNIHDNPELLEAN